MQGIAYCYILDNKYRVAHAELDFESDVKGQV